MPYLTPKQLETHGCVISNVATGALVLKQETISAHSADKIIIVLDQFHTEILHLKRTTRDNRITVWKHYPVVYQLKKNSGFWEKVASASVSETVSSVNFIKPIKVETSTNGNSSQCFGNPVWVIYICLLIRQDLYILCHGSERWCIQLNNTKKVEGIVAFLSSTADIVSEDYWCRAVLRPSVCLSVRQPFFKSNRLPQFSANLSGIWLECAQILPKSCGSRILISLLLIFSMEL